MITDLKHTIMEQVKSRNRSKLWLIAVSMLAFQSCASLNGIYPIAKNVYLMDSGTPKEKIIIFNPEGNVRNIVSGIPIVPSNEEFQREDVYEYVEDYSYNGEWLMAKTQQLTDSSSCTRYWIIHLPINKEYDYQEITNSTYGPLSSAEYDSVLYVQLPMNGQR